jgi:hypothetical protein
MKFDPIARTLTLESTDCRNCSGGRAGAGRQFARKTCLDCGGSGKGKRGKRGGCNKCIGQGTVIDFDNTVLCPVCQGDFQDASFENWCDTAPSAAMATLEVQVVRQNRETTWNEQFLGVNCFWSCTDYGTQWDKGEAGDRELAVSVYNELCNSRVQAVKLWPRSQYDSKATTMPMPERAYVIVSRSGYSVRPEVPRVTGALPRNTYDAIISE